MAPRSSGAYATGAVLALGVAPVVAAYAPWGGAKALALAVVGVAYAVAAFATRRARRDGASAAGAAAATVRAARVVANVGWGAFAVLFVVERASR